MNTSDVHQFHIPVLGLAYSVDTPVKVARFGISSVMSIIEDEMIEQMRQYYCQQTATPYIPINTTEDDFRAKRITDYLNLVQAIVQNQMEVLRNLPFGQHNDIDKYFMMLPSDSSLRRRYEKMLKEQDEDLQYEMQEHLRKDIVAGSLDVNIMAKVDNLPNDEDGNPKPFEYSDALSALRGFALSHLNSSMVFSAGYNPRLYNYIEQFDDFFPDENGDIKKKIILKVSDYRSALIQGKILAKKGLWISEFRIESGLNCGGHAFATEGLLLGPILEEFKNKRGELFQELFTICNAALLANNKQVFLTKPKLKITAQGGIGTHFENDFLIQHFKLDGTGWGSPFLLVPEATNVDENTLNELSIAEQDDYFLSQASPLGVPFNNFRKSTAEIQRNQRIEKGRPGSPCYKKFLSTNTEFTTTPICTASRQYQNLKIKQLEAASLSKEELAIKMQEVLEKDCLCEGLCAPVLLKNDMPIPHRLKAVSICPGPNLAYFSGIFSLNQMVDHIYGRINILNNLHRPNMFINELQLYVNYLRTNLDKTIKEMDVKQNKYFQNFKSNLLSGIAYYKEMIPYIRKETDKYIATMTRELAELENTLMLIAIPSVIKVENLAMAK